MIYKVHFEKRVKKGKGKKDKGIRKKGGQKDNTASKQKYLNLDLDRQIVIILKNRMLNF